MLKKIFSISATVLIFAVVAESALPPATASAVTASDWSAGRIIDDFVFTDKNSMSAADIQNFLNQKVGTGTYGTPGVCDTNGTRTSEYGGGTRAQYGAAHGHNAPYTCLKDYYEVPKLTPGPGMPANNYGGQPIPAGAKSAAQLIYDAAQANNISPKVLLVIIQKESAGPLITDDWPYASQYTYAMGAHCPDSTGCDSNYSGFSIQISESAALLRYYLDNMSQPWWPYKKLGSNSILYNPNTGCGSSNVNILTMATAALYTYTPYQPNQAALNNLYGTGDSCSAYGNRNFWRIYSDWFGSTHATGEILNNSLGTNQLSPGTTMNAGDYIVSPNGKFVTTLQYDGNLVTYTGSRAVWNSGTPGSYGNYVVFQSDGNLVVYNASNIALWWSGTWGAGATAASLGDDGNLHVYANSTQLYSTNNKVNTYATNSVGSQISSGTRLNSGDYLQSPDGRYSLVMQGDGNLVAYSADSVTIWSSSTRGHTGNYAILQNDGNFVVYSANNAPLWWSGSWGNGASTLKMQNDGNLVTYRNSDNGFTWATWTQFNNYQVNTYIGTQITSGTTLHAGEYLRSPDWRYTLVMQEDGNLVVYAADRYTPIWNSHTWNNGSAYLTMQNDGNLVVYDKNGKALWNTFTYTAGASVLKMQSDGNLVTYRNADNAYTWDSYGF